MPDSPDPRTVDAAVDRIEAVLQPLGRCTECGGGADYWKHNLLGDPPNYHEFQPPLPDRPVADREPLSAAIEALPHWRVMGSDLVDRNAVLATLDAARSRPDEAGLLDGIREEVREAVIEGDANDCSSPDCIADAVYEIVRVRLRSTAPAAVPGLDVERLARAMHLARRLPEMDEPYCDNPLTETDLRGHVAHAEAILHALSMLPPYPSERCDFDCDACRDFAAVKADPTVCEVCGNLADGEPGRCHRHFKKKSDEYLSGYEDGHDGADKTHVPHE